MDTMVKSTSIEEIADRMYGFVLSMLEARAWIEWTVDDPHDEVGVESNDAA